MLNREIGQTGDDIALEAFAILVEGKFILYRPLLQLAFVGNRAMADLALGLAGNEASTPPDAPEEAVNFLESVGFLAPDPEPPPPPNRTFRPTMAVLLLTSRCNLHCTYCYASGGEGPAQDLSLESAQVAIDHVCQNALERGRSHFDLTFHGGGEPIQAWETLRAAVTYARNKDLPCRTSVVTNGIWSARQRDWLLHNMDGLTISFDGQQETQDRQRPFASGRGSFKSVMRMIETLDQAEFPYGIRMTATAPWREQLAEDVRFICEETGCQVMQVEPAFNIHRGEHQGPTQEESEAFVDAFMAAFEIAQQASRRLTYSGARPWLLTQTFCTAPYNALIVSPVGNLVTCYEIASESHSLAEISTVGCITSDQIIVDEQARNALMDYLEAGRAKCRDCFCRWHCAGDCYTRAYFSQANSGEELSPRCIMNREITARILLWYIMAADGVWRGRKMHPQEAQLLRAF